ncbi:uncharacterized protein jakmip1 isoform X3 [Channa argus]|uniref:uncharacterized protein jakmip1 isoform X3 n=1 Tax=Channa argus TaxID=215402 RepID=UPI00352277A4
MQHSQRLDHRLQMLRGEVRAMTLEKERGEQVWKERLQRCQRQLKAKEDEMSRQSQYFENFKTQLQHKLTLAQDREQSLQSRIYTLEKQLLDMIVSAATGAAMISAVRITGGTMTFWKQQERLTTMRGEGEGEEERKEEKRKQWQPSVETERESGQDGDEGKSEKDTEGERNKDTRQSSDEARLQRFILSLQEDLRVLLEREEDGMTERKRLMEQLQGAQENSHFLGCQMEEMKAEMQRLKLSESSLLEEAEELREENHRLQQVLKEATNQIPSQSSQISESTCRSLGTSSPNCSTICPRSSNTTMTHSFVRGFGEVQGATSEGLAQTYSSAVPHVHHQDAAETVQKKTNDHSSSAKSDPVNLSACQGSRTNPNFQTLSLTTETIDEFKLGTLCSRGILNLEKNPSEESDALREAYRSMGLQKDLEALQEHSDSLEVALQHTQQLLQVMSEENIQLNLHLKKQAEEEAEAEQGSSREKIILLSSCNGADHPQPSSTPDNTILSLAQDDLALALNQENRALADRIQELLAHIELREEEVKKEETQLKEHISKLEEDRASLEQEKQEQGCLITELTRKTEDDLNTIMDLQQNLEESREQHNLKVHVGSLGDNVLNREELQLISGQQIADLTTASAPGSQHNNPSGLLQNSLQNTLQVSSLTDQVDQLIKSIQILKTDREELLGHLNCLREQQKEVALSVQIQTEEKQHLTRTIWGLKEEKDNISKSLAGLKQEREEFSKAVSALKNSRDNFIRSMSGLKEEKETLSGLEKEKQALMESLSSGKLEQDQILQSIQCLQRQNAQLGHEGLNLKQERDELTNSLKCLKENRDQFSYTLQEDCDKLKKSINSLREEKGQAEHSVSCLKQEEKQLRLEIQGLRVEKNSVHSAFISQTQTEERKQMQHLLNPNGADMTLVGIEEYDAEKCHIKNFKGNSTWKQSDLMREIEALGEQLKRSREELEETRAETKKLQSELCQSEARREEAEKKATQATEKGMRVIDLASQVEEIRTENASLTSQVRELQSSLTGVVREKTDAQLVKTQIEEQYNILSAQLRAKSVALEELNSEYIALKQGQGSKNDLSGVLTSLWTRYNNIRAKYDALLKRKSHTDLDIAPLKAKLSCLVVKCQERNSLLVQMMKAMHRHGCMDSTLTQQVEQLLSDSALQDYTATFTPGKSVNTQNHSAGFKAGFISDLPHYSGGLPPDPSSPAILPSVNKGHQNGFSEPGVKCRDLKSENHTCTTRECTENLQYCSSEVTVEKSEKNANFSPVQELINIYDSPSPAAPLKEALNTNTTQLFHSACGSEKLEFHHPDMKGKFSPGFTNLTESSPSPSSPLSSQGSSPSRRLSSPEKIINLHKQLQKTLMSSYQAPMCRGREEQPRKSLLFSAPADLISGSQTSEQNIGFDNPHSNSSQVTTGHTTNIPVIKPTAINKSVTLFNAVGSRSAGVKLSPNVFTDNHNRTVTSKTTTFANSGSSHLPLATMPLNKAKSISSSGSMVSLPTTSTKQMTISDISDAPRPAATPLTLRATGLDLPLSIGSDTNPKNTASDRTASSMSAPPKVNIFNMTSKTDGAALSYDDFVFTASCTPTTHPSPENSETSARRSPAGLEKTKRARPKPEAPAEVSAVEVIRTVGQSSLMIGWERPPLDELGCSNGTFVYGYRVFIDGDFHKSVMSSACTKCLCRITATSKWKSSSLGAMVWAWPSLAAAP